MYNILSPDERFELEMAERTRYLEDPERQDELRDLAELDEDDIYEWTMPRRY